MRYNALNGRPPLHTTLRQLLPIHAGRLVHPLRRPISPRLGGIRHSWLLPGFHHHPQLCIPQTVGAKTVAQTALSHRRRLPFCHRAWVDGRYRQRRHRDTDGLPGQCRIDFIPHQLSCSGFALVSERLANLQSPISALYDLFISGIQLLYRATLK